MIHLSDIDNFVEVAKLGNLSRAAQRLGLSQPALSHCIHRVENALEAELFFRSKKGMELTPQGKRFFEQAHTLTNQWQQLVESVHDEVNQAVGTIKLGVHTAVAQYTLPKFMPSFLNSYPKLSLQLNHGLSRHMTEKVVSSELDAAIVVNPVKHPDLVIVDLCKDVVTVWHSKQCKNLKTLMVDPALIQSQDILRKLSKKGFDFTNTIESTSLEVIAQLMVAGAGCAILPERVVKAFSQGKAVQVKNAPQFNDRICLVFRPEFKKALRGQVFIDAAKAAKY
ncbi:MAG: LysR family transcriptional regulator [Bdellovibrionales bacterium]